MAHQLRRKDVSSSIEKSILTALIVSTQFNNEVAHVINLDYFTNSFIKKVARWCLDFFDAYDKAPFNHIQDIFNERKTELKEAEADLIEKLLLDISKRYELDSGLNVDYSVEQALRFFKSRELKIVHGNIGLLLDKNDIDGAEEQINKYTKVARITSGWINPFDEQYVDEVFSSNGRMLTLPGELGKFLGSFDKQWLVAVAAGFKRGKCVSENCLIPLPDGRLKSIKDIIQDRDKYIISLDNCGKFIKSEITDYYKNGVKPVYRVETKIGHTVDVTDIHPFLTIDGWKELNELNIGDAIAVPRNIPFFGDKIVEDYKLRFLAYMVADGCLVNNFYSYTKYDIGMQQDFKKCVELFGDTWTVCTTDVNSFYIKSNKKDKRNCIKWLDSIGMIKCKSKYKVLPDIIFQLNKKSLSLFLSALFSGDGSIYRESKSKDTICIEYSSASKDLILQIKHLLLRFGIVSSYRKKKVKLNGKKFDAWLLIVRNKENVLRFLDKIGFQFNKKTKANELKKILLNNKSHPRNMLDLFYNIGEKLLPIVESTRGCYKERKLVLRSINKNKGISRYTLKRIANKTGDKWINELVNSDIIWDKIVDISYIGNQETYDLTVEDTHNFIANDIVVHNSMSLQEILIAAIMQNLRVAWFSLEMTKKATLDRWYKRLLGAADPEGGPAVYPCFDCTKNQDGTCKKRERVNKVPLLGDKGKPIFTAQNKYKPCTVCRFDSPYDYSVAWWYELIDRPAYTNENVKKHLAALRRTKNKLYRFLPYPKFSAGIDDFKRDLDLLERSEGFVPHVIIVDQANGMKPRSGISNNGIDSHDDNWKGLAGLAGERYACVISPTQVTRSALKKKAVAQDDVAQWVGLLGHVDAAYSLNQSDIEKSEGVMRYNMMIHRHDDFDERASCIVLQNINYGQFYLDAYISK